LQTTKNFFKIISVLGALLIAGLFFYFRSSEELKQTSLKPSRMNFVQGNEFSHQPAVTANVTAHKAVQPEVVVFRPENLTVEDQNRWATFEEILITKNDNDRRMDTQLKNLSPALREALYKKYDSIPAEDRSAKGLVVFLVAREIKTIEDIEFLKKVYQETPCLSLADCKIVGSEDPHHSSVNETTLTYPQQSGLYLIEKQLKENPQLLNNAAFRSGVIQILVQAENFAVPAIREKARAIRQTYGL
jgi:hypothetical protein